MMKFNKRIKIRCSSSEVYEPEDFLRPFYNGVRWPLGNNVMNESLSFKVGEEIIMWLSGESYY